MSELKQIVTCEIIGGLDEGDQVQKMGQEGDWIQIEYDGQTGYVYSGLLQ